MRKLPFILLIVCFSCNEESIENYIEAEITSTIKLPKEINETSGLEIINNNFIGWPTDPRLNGYSVGEKVLDNNTDRISKIDLHPNKQGQEKLARFIYDRLG